MELTKIPNLTEYTHFGEFKKIKYLFLNDNNLTNCGYRLDYFPNLEVLDISHNNITEITYLPINLKEFVCTNNKLKCLPSHNSIKILDCMSNMIEEIGSFIKLKDLNCSDNKIKQIKYFPLIKRLICRQNPITKIESLPLLEDLDCSETQIIGELNGLPSLKGLICNFTKINIISSLLNLETLEIINCKINIPFLPKLKYLLCNKLKNDEDDSIKLSSKLKIKNLIDEGSVMCIIFVVNDQI